MNHKITRLCQYAFQAVALLFLSVACARGGLSPLDSDSTSLTQTSRSVSQARESVLLFPTERGVGLGVNLSCLQKIQKYVSSGYISREEAVETCSLYDKKTAQSSKKGRGLWWQESESECRQKVCWYNELVEKEPGVWYYSRWFNPQELFKQYGLQYGMWCHALKRCSQQKAQSYAYGGDQSLNPMLPYYQQQTGNNPACLKCFTTSNPAACMYLMGCARNAGRAPYQQSNFNPMAFNQQPSFGMPGQYNQNGYGFNQQGRGLPYQMPFYQQSYGQQYQSQMNHPLQFGYGGY